MPHLGTGFSCCLETPPLSFLTIILFIENVEQPFSCMARLDTFHFRVLSGNFLPRIHNFLRFFFRWKMRGKLRETELGHFARREPLTSANIPELRVLLKQCTKNDGVIRGLFAHDDDRWRDFLLNYYRNEGSYGEGIFTLRFCYVFSSL